ncbi:MAG TPA: TIGR03086 family metal-binding protein [Streptosporangiaceae bacterium]|nr:TIGR03086 family metal-binding protein [Streptosporangiaceae bacterium]
MTAGPGGGVGQLAVSQLAEALDATGQLIAAVPEARWADPTPCPGWTVRDLVSHLVAGNAMFAGEFGSQYQPPDGQDLAAGTVGADLLPAYRDSAAALLDAFGQPGALDTIVTVPFGTVPGIVALHLRITEVLVHGWDLAEATGQLVAFSEDVAEQELAFSRDKLSDIPPGRRPFAPPQPVADDAPAIDRLAACLGRTVTA